MMNPMAKLPVNFTAIPVNSQREVKHKRIAQKKEKKKRKRRRRRYPSSRSIIRSLKHPPLFDNTEEFCLVGENNGRTRTRTRARKSNPHFTLILSFQDVKDLSQNNRTSELSGSSNTRTHFLKSQFPTSPTVSQQPSNPIQNVTTQNRNSGTNQERKTQK